MIESVKKYFRGDKINALTLEVEMLKKFLWWEREQKKHYVKHAGNLADNLRYKKAITQGHNH
jgi:hypothetical protein